MISCLCITRGDRPDLLSDAVSDFVRQTFSDRELVILHDGDDAADARVEAIVATHAGASIRIEHAPPGQRLGGLRNLAIALARGEWICQWDDDDRYHPERLRLQWEHARSEQAAVNYLVDQLHWFPADNSLFWDDWGDEPYPMNVIQGTILARRDVMPPYPDIGRGEDTLQTHALLRAEAASKAFRVSRLRGIGWCYIYRFHGGNAWDAAHHRAISAVKHLPPAKLLSRLALLRDRLKDYQPQLPSMRMQLGTGTKYATLGELDDLAGSPEREVQAAFFLRSPTASTSANRSAEDGPDSDVQIP
ncbi:MAG TPA: glycosyltransferase family A protein [Stellaceae bacterium]|jgi:glycosyltransferase involved in cell wall biosynthesis